jgi:uncharacterized protein involved in outer membrane biogenesis
MNRQFNAQAADTLFDKLEHKAAKKPTFNWQQNIIEVLKSKEGKEMPLNRLQKKVLAEFEATGAGSATDVKSIEKFNKNLHKIPGLVIRKEIAILTH